MKKFTKKTITHNGGGINTLRNSRALSDVRFVR